MIGVKKQAKIQYNIDIQQAPFPFGNYARIERMRNAQWVLEQLYQGNKLAYCNITITAYIGNTRVVKELKNQTFANQLDFLTSEVIPKLKTECKNELIKQISELYK